MRHFIYFTYLEANVISLHIYKLSYVRNKLICNRVTRWFFIPAPGCGALFPITWRDFLRHRIIGLFASAAVILSRRGRHGEFDIKFLVFGNES